MISIHSKNDPHRHILPESSSRHSLEQHHFSHPVSADFKVIVIYLNFEKQQKYCDALILNINVLTQKKVSYNFIGFRKKRVFNITGSDVVHVHQDKQRNKTKRGLEEL